jgi:hypothetical protein
MTIRDNALYTLAELLGGPTWAVAPPAKWKIESYPLVIREHMLVKAVCTLGL